MSSLFLGFTGKQAAALASVGQAAASTDPTLPALRTVKITATTVDDGAVVEAVATDRFVAARIRFTLPTDSIVGDGTFLINATHLTEIARAAKKHKGKDTAVVISVHDDRYTVEYWDGTEQTSTFPEFDYPPVENLIPYTTRDLFNIPAGSVMNPALLAKAAKLKRKAARKRV
jgi:hypothetical protein